MKKSPSIRFNGFTDDWEQRNFEDIAERASTIGSAPDLPRIEFEDIMSGLGQLNKDVYAKGSTKVGIVFHAGDVLYGKLRPYLHNLLLPDFSGLAVGDFWVLQPKNVDSKFLYRLVQSRRFDVIANQYTGTKMPRADWKLVSKSEFALPHSIEEQAQIGQYLNHLDAVVSLHGHKYEKMSSVLLSMREKLFAKPGNPFPENRFSGFEGEWETRRLGDMVVPYADPVPTPHDGYERLGIRSHGKGTFYNHVAAGEELETAQMHRVAANKLIVNITFAWEHAVAVTDEKDAGKLVSHRFPQFSLCDELHPRFLQYLILDERFRHHLLLASPGGAGRNRVLKIAEMMEYQVRVPNYEEQKKIADFLYSLDELTKFYAMRIEKLKNIKAACLEGMFV